MAVPIAIGRPRSVAAAKAATEGERKIGIILQRDPKVDVPATTQLFEIGTAANIVRHLTAADGGHHLICQGHKRFRVVSLIEGRPYHVARVEWLQEDAADAASSEVEARLSDLRQRALEILELPPQSPVELSAAIQTIGGPRKFESELAMRTSLPERNRKNLLDNPEAAK